MNKSTIDEKMQLKLHNITDDSDRTKNFTILPDHSSTQNQKEIMPNSSKIVQIASPTTIQQLPPTINTQNHNNQLQKFVKNIQLNHQKTRIELQKRLSNLTIIRKNRSRRSSDLHGIVAGPTSPVENTGGVPSGADIEINGLPPEEVPSFEPEQVVLPHINAHPEERQDSAACVQSSSTQAQAIIHSPNINNLFKNSRRETKILKERVVNVMNRLKNTNINFQITRTNNDGNSPTNEDLAVIEKVGEDDNCTPTNEIPDSQNCDEILGSSAVFYQVPPVPVPEMKNRNVQNLDEKEITNDRDRHKLFKKLSVDKQLTNSDSTSNISKVIKSKFQNKKKLNLKINSKNSKNSHGNVNVNSNIPEPTSPDSIKIDDAGQINQLSASCSIANLDKLYENLVKDHFDDPNYIPEATTGSENTSLSAQSCKQQFPNQFQTSSKQSTNQNPFMSKNKKASSRNRTLLQDLTNLKRKSKKDKVRESQKLKMSSKNLLQQSVSASLAINENSNFNLPLYERQRSQEEFNCSRSESSLPLNYSRVSFESKSIGSIMSRSSNMNSGMMSEMNGDFIFKPFFDRK